MSITTNTRKLSPEIIDRAMRGLEPDFVRTISVEAVPGSNLSEADPYLLGCRMHNLLFRTKDRGPLSREEKELLPWLAAIRKELRKFGMRYMEPEVSLPATEELPAGRTDWLMRGGITDLGVGEMKVTAFLPAEASGSALVQLGGYAELTAKKYGDSRIWAVLVHVSIKEKKVRLFIHRGSTMLRRRACPLLAA